MLGLEVQIKKDGSVVLSQRSLVRGLTTWSKSYTSPSWTISSEGCRNPILYKGAMVTRHDGPEKGFGKSSDVATPHQRVTRPRQDFLALAGPRVRSCLSVEERAHDESAYQSNPQQFPCSCHD